MKNIKIELSEDELHAIMNILTVKSLSGNLDEEDKTLGRKINKALKKNRGGDMLKAIYFALHFAMLMLGTVIAIHIDLWLGLAIAITFGVKFFFMLPNNKEGF